MKLPQIIFIALAAFLFINCGGKGAAVTTQTARPGDVLKTFIEASKKKDVEGIKKTLSRGSLALAEKSAAMQKTTVDEMFKGDNSTMPDEAFETRDEKIEGDTATVEVKDRTGGYDTIPFVKEDGAWKIAFDKYQEIMMEKMRQEMNIPVTNTSVSNSNQQPGNKPAANNK